MAAHQARNTIDEHFETYDVTDTIATTIDVDLPLAIEALDRVDLGAALGRTLGSLGFAGRLASSPELLAAESDDERVYGLAWRTSGADSGADVETARLAELDGPGHVKVVWDVRILPNTAGGAVLSATTRFAATDDAARERLLDAWGTIGKAARQLVRQALRAVKSYAEASAESPSLRRETRDAGCPVFALHGPEPLSRLVGSLAAA
jgi:hypothetical protein